MSTAREIDLKKHLASKVQAETRRRKREVARRFLNRLNIPTLADGSTVNALAENMEKTGENPEIWEFQYDGYIFRFCEWTLQVLCWRKRGKKKTWKTLRTGDDLSQTGDDLYRLLDEEAVSADDHPRISVAPPFTD